MLTIIGVNYVDFLGARRNLSFGITTAAVKFVKGQNTSLKNVGLFTF